MANSTNIKAVVKADTQAAENGFDHLGSKILQFKKKAETSKKTMDQAAKANTSLTKSLATTAAKYGLMALAANQAKKVLVDSIKSYAQAEEVQNKFNAVFKNGADDVKEWAVDYARSVGRGKTETMAFLATLQDTFVPLGFARDKASEMSKTMVKLAGDLGSFNNLDTADVIADLQSAVVGNTETLRKYGVVASQTAIEQFALERGIISSKKELDAQTKAYAILQMTILGTQDAQGDLLSTQDSLTNKTRALKSAFKEMKEELGEMASNELPTALDVLTKLVSKATEWFNRNNEYNSKQELVESILNGGEGTLPFTTAKEYENLLRTLSVQKTAPFRGKEFKDGIQEQIDIVQQQFEWWQRNQAAAAKYGKTVGSIDINSLPLMNPEEKKEPESTEPTISEKLAEGYKALKLKYDNLAAAGFEVKSKDFLNEKLKFVEGLFDELTKAGVGASSPEMQEVISALNGVRGEINEEDPEIKKSLERIKQLWAEKAETQMILDETEAAKEAAHQRELERIKAERDARVEAQRVALSTSLSLATSLFDNFTKLYDKDSEEYKKAIHAKAIADKMIAVAQTTISTINAATKALEAGPIAGPILSGLIMGMGMANAGIITATPIPALADGGVALPRPGGQIVQVAEAGQPEAIIPLNKFKDINSPSSSNITINVYGTVGSQEEVGTWVYEGIEKAKKTGLLAS